MWPGVNRIDEVADESITVSQDLARSVETVRLPYPCLLTVEKDIYEPPPA